jgi:excisionase family DNA binding protein
MPDVTQKDTKPMGQKVTIADTEKILGLSKRSVRRLITTGQLRAYKLGALVRIDVDDIDRMLAASEVVPSGKP